MAGGKGQIIRIALQFLRKVRKRVSGPGGPAPRHSTPGWPPSQARGRVPAEWGPGQATRKGVGWRWTDPANPGNGVRVDQAVPHSPSPSQRVDHVVVRQNGVVLGRDGKPIAGSIKSDAENAHIPLSDWLNWSRWDTP